MALLKVFIEADAVLDLPLAGVETDTRDWDVQQHRPEVLAEIKRRLEAAFGQHRFKLVTLEYGLADEGLVDTFAEGSALGEGDLPGFDRGTMT